eukprot:4253639-Amphidinium_carterae.1
MPPLMTCLSSKRCAFTLSILIGTSCPLSTRVAKRHMSTSLCMDTEPVASILGQLASGARGSGSCRADPEHLTSLQTSALARLSRCTLAHLESKGGRVVSGVVRGRNSVKMRKGSKGHRRKSIWLADFALIASHPSAVRTLHSS